LAKIGSVFGKNRISFWQKSDQFLAKFPYIFERMQKIGPLPAIRVNPALGIGSTKRLDQLFWKLHNLHELLWKFIL
jgi:hypothetical protein